MLLKLQFKNKAYGINILGLLIFPMAFAFMHTLHLPTYIYIYIYIYIIFTTEGFFQVSIEKLARVGPEPTTSEFRSDALTD